MSRTFSWMVTAVLCCSALVTSVFPASAAEQRKFALLVGVNHYEKRGLRDLEFAERDVEELAAVLEKAGYQVSLLTSSRTDDRRATLANIRTYLDRVLDDLNKEDLVLIGLAGHGYQIETQKDGKTQADSYFCPTDAQRGDAESMLSVTTLLEEIDKRGAGNNLLLVDACREDPTRGRGMDGATVKTLPEGVAVLFGCGSGQKTFETKQAGGGHGVFFHYVIEGFKGAAANDAGDVTWSRLSEYVSECVELKTPGLLGDETAKQTPFEIKNLPGRSPVLARADAGYKPDIANLPTKTPTTNTPMPNSVTTTTPGTTPTTTPVPSPMPMPPLPEQPADQIQNGIGMNLVLIRPGTFMMGAANNDRDAEAHEKPQHRVELTFAYYLGQTEVTQGQWKAVMGTTPWRGQQYVQEGDDNAASWVTYAQATEFCERLSKMEGKTYRLPTEAEWEYAARAGSTDRYFFGDDITALNNYAWNGGVYGQGGNSRDALYAHQVKQRQPNPFGLYDMAGNVYEWCYDWYDANFYRRSPTQDPYGPDNAITNQRVIRGGSWYCFPNHCRVTYRYGEIPNNRMGYLGFRVLMLP